MTHNVRYIKTSARKAFKGRWSYGVAGTLMIEGLGMLGRFLAVELFPGTEVLPLVLSEIFLFIFSVVTLIFSTGYNYMLLNMARGREFGFQDFVSMFHRGTDGVLLAGGVIALIQTLVAIPFYYVAYFADAGDTLDLQLVWAVTCCAYFLVSVVLSFLFTLPFAMTFFLLADEPKQNGIHTLEKSFSMMKGNMGKYLLLQLSFFPYWLLSLFTFGIALLWVLPYMQMASAQFYRDLSGELE